MVFKFFSSVNNCYYCR